MDLEEAVGVKYAEFKEVHGREYLAFSFWYRERGGFDGVMRRWGKGEGLGGSSSIGGISQEVAGHVSGKAEGTTIKSVKREEEEEERETVDGEEPGGEVSDEALNPSLGDVRDGDGEGGKEIEEGAAWASSEEFLEEVEEKVSEDEEGDDGEEEEEQQGVAGVQRVSGRVLNRLKGAKAFAALPAYKMSARVGGRAAQVWRVAYGAVALYGSQDGSLLQWPESFFYSNELDKARLTKRGELADEGLDK